jgi:outer membrane protein, multidrug efflux system
MKKVLQFSTLFLGLVAAGCASIGPDYHAPVERPVTLQGVSAEKQSNAAVPAQWWSQFGDPVLDELMGLAVKDSPDLAIARARLRESRAELGSAKSDQIPTINTGVDYERDRGQQPGFGPDRTTVTTYRAGFDASWELDLFGGVRRSVEAATAETQGSEASLADVQVSLFGEIARNYFELRGTQLRLDVARRNIDNQKETVRLTTARYEIGSGSEQDVASAQARLSETEAALPSLETDAHAEQTRIAVLVGQRPDELTVDLSPKAFTPIDTVLPIGGADDVLRRRPDVVTAERKLAAANARIGVAKADYFPHISLGGFVGFLAGSSNNFGGAQSRAWSVAPSISWAGLNVQRVRSGVKASEAQADAALAEYQRTVLRAIEDVDNSLVGYNLQHERLIKLVDRADQSRRAADLAKIRYDEGATDFLVLLDAQREQLAAEDQLAEGQAAVNTRAVALYKALGGGWNTAPATSTASR